MLNSEYICAQTGGRRGKVIEAIYANCLLEDRGYETPCLIWQGSHTGSEGRGANYPKMSLDGQMVRVHRVVFVHFEGYLHSKRQVDHKCHQRMCVRFEHLQAVTQKKNCLLRDQKNGVVRRKRRRKLLKGPKAAARLGRAVVGREVLLAHADGA